jgi:hypothetical protein
MVEPGNDPSDDDATKPLPEQPDAAGGASTEPIGPGSVDPDAPTQLLGPPLDGPIETDGTAAATEPIAPHVPIADLGATGAVVVPGPGDSAVGRSRRRIAPWLLAGLAAVLLVVLAIAILPGLLNNSGVVTGPSVPPSPSQTPTAVPSAVPSTVSSVAPPVEAPPATPAAPNPGTGGGSGPQPTQNPPTVQPTAPVPEPTVSAGP